MNNVSHKLVYLSLEVHINMDTTYIPIIKLRPCLVMKRQRCFYFSNATTILCLMHKELW